MKLKFLIVFISFFFAFYQPAKAIEVEEAKIFFENYVKLCHAYDKAVLDQYSDEAIIKRILIHSNGKNETVILATDDYKNKLKFYRYLAIVTKYKTIYHDLKYSKEGQKVRLIGYRQVISEDYRTPINILVGKDKTGKIKILEETLHTKGIHFFKKKK